MAFYKFVHMSDARYMHKFEHMHNNVYSEVGIFVQPVLFRVCIAPTTLHIARNASNKQLRSLIISVWS